jgi:hypothetical protein
MPDDDDAVPPTAADGGAPGEEAPMLPGGEAKARPPALRRWLPALMLVLGAGIGIGVALLATSGDDSGTAVLGETATSTTVSTTSSTAVPTTASPAPTTVAPTTTAAPSATTRTSAAPVTAAPVTAAPATAAPTTAAPATTAPTTLAITSFKTSASVINCTTNAPNPVQPVITLTWTTLNATKVDLSIDGPGIYDSYGPQGSVQVNVPCDGQKHTYTITAHSAQGQKISATLEVTVNKS